MKHDTLHEMTEIQAGFSATPKPRLTQQNRTVTANAPRLRSHRAPALSRRRNNLRLQQNRDRRLCVCLRFVIRPRVRRLFDLLKLQDLCFVPTKALMSCLINLLFVFYLTVSFFLKQPDAPLVHRIVYYKRLYIFFSINIYVQMKGGQEET